MLLVVIVAKAHNKVEGIVLVFLFPHLLLNDLHTGRGDVVSVLVLFDAYIPQALFSGRVKGRSGAAIGV